MSTQDSDNLNDLLAAAAHDLDALTPEQIDQLERHLNESPQAAARLADKRPPPMRFLGGRAVSAAPAPAAAEWDAVFERIESAAQDAPFEVRAAEHAARRAHHRLIHLWQPWVAAAACLLLALVWQYAPTQTGDPWELKLATDVVVNELEVFGDASSFVAYTDDGIPIIWVFENDNGGGQGV